MTMVDQEMVAINYQEIPIYMRFMDEQLQTNFYWFEKSHQELSQPYISSYHISLFLFHHYSQKKNTLILHDNNFLFAGKRGSSLH